MQDGFKKFNKILESNIKSKIYNLEKSLDNLIKTLKAKDL